MTKLRALAAERNAQHEVTGVMLDFRSIAYPIGSILSGLAVLTMIAALVGLEEEDGSHVGFIVSSIITGFTGIALALSTRPEHQFSLSLRETFVLTTGCWLVLPAFGALPFTLVEPGLSYTDAFFESMSGLTTTGSTVMTGLDAQPPAILLWRSLLQWMGGIGIVVMAIVILPFLRIGGMQLFQRESSDKSDRLVGTPVELVSYIAGIYVFLSALCAILYASAGMSAFDAVNHAMTTVATGGYSTHDASFGYFTQPTIHWLGVVFMLSGALPFVAYVKLTSRPRSFFQDAQIRGIVIFLASVTLLLTFWVWRTSDTPFLDALRHAAFNVTSIVTTTGYASTDYQLWGSIAVAVFFLITLVGGCAGSTSGGVKIYRWQILWVMARGYWVSLFSPSRVLNLRYDRKPVSLEAIYAVMAFITATLIVVGGGTLILGAFGLDLVTAASSAAEAFANVGPGLGPIVGPAGNFATLPDGAKWTLSMLMLLGRLEIFTVIVLLDPEFWRR